MIEGEKKKRNRMKRAGLDRFIHLAQGDHLSDNGALMCCEMELVW